MEIRVLLITALLICCLICGLISACAADTKVPRPEYPTPQMVRSEWVNLNGTWEFAETNDSTDNSYLNIKTYPDRIIVPFPRESKLSGLEHNDYVTNVWYRRTFQTPVNWKSPRVLLHVGACDWKTTVWLNGHYLGDHEGGSTPFAFDITEYLRSGNNTIIIHAFDDCRSGLQGTGKQTRNISQGCVYTRTTGIWQTVWLEGVGSSYLKDFQIVTDPAESRVFIQSEVDGPCNGLTLKATAYAGNKIVGSAKCPADWRNGRLVIDLSDKHLWSIQNPFLYNLKLALIKKGKTIDTVRSYFGLRNISIDGTAILINGKSVFQRLVLDQGFYPDGIWTAPSDQALRHDIELSKAAGFNGARLHQKVFEPRSLYWADKLGYLLWGEYPNWGMSYTKTEALIPMIREWVSEVRRDRNHPSIVGWCPFNETPGEAAEVQNTVVELAHAIDPTRPILDTSGFSHSLPDGEVSDAHDYDQNPETFRVRWLDSFSSYSPLPPQYGSGYTSNAPFMVSEYGGTVWTKEDKGWGYGSAPKNMQEFYDRYAGLTNALLDSRNMFGFCYTQLTDVEQECNGIYTYDRKPKFDIKKIYAINSREAACEKYYKLKSGVNKLWQVLVGAAPDKKLAHEWRYTTEQPVQNWNMPEFDDRSWKTGFGAFGEKPGWAQMIHTLWTTKDIWLRQEFKYDGKPFSEVMLVVHFDDASEIYINGLCIWKRTGWSDHYINFDVTKNVKTAIRPGNNTIAIHCWQDWGGQFIDAALLARD